MPKTTSRLFIAILSILFFVAQASANDFPAQVEVDGKTLHLLGVGTRKATIFKVKVYNGGLYVEDKSKFDRNNDSIKFVRLKFLRDVSQDDVRDVWKEALPKSCGNPCSLNFEPVLENVKDVKKGDIHEFALYPDRTVIKQAELKSEFKQPGLSRVILGTWVGDHPPNKELKEGMLGR